MPAVTDVLPFLQNHPGWAVLLVFATAFVESLIIIGFIVPGWLVIFGAGSLVGAQVLPFWPVVLATYAGAVTGEGLGFWAGHTHSETVRRSRWLQQHQGLVIRSEKLFQRYGVWSLVFGRFVGPVRAVLPFIAGLLQFPPRMYWPVNFATALIWAPFYALIPGMLVGVAMDHPVSELWPLVFYLAFMLALLWMAAQLWSVRKGLSITVLLLALAMALTIPALPWTPTLLTISASLWSLIA